MASKEGLLFGTAGIPVSSKAQSTKAGIERIRELGLDCMEVEFVLGVRISSQAAEAAGELAARRRVRLSAHSPYYVNLNAREPEKLEASRERILRTARITSLLGGKSIVFHAAYYMKDAPDKVYAAVKENLEQVVSELREEGNELYLDQSYQGALDSVRESMEKLKSIEELAIEIKNQALMWVYITEWLAVTGTGLLCGFVIWTLMIRRGLYREIETTRLRERSR